MRMTRWIHNVKNNGEIVIYRADRLGLYNTMVVWLVRIISELISKSVMAAPGNQQAEIDYQKHVLIRHTLQYAAAIF